MTPSANLAELPSLGSPRDIANGCVFLPSDEAEYINGVLLPIDGGLSCKLGIPDESALSAISEGRGLGDAFTRDAPRISMPSL